MDKEEAKAALVKQFQRLQELAREIDKSTNDACYALVCNDCPFDRERHCLVSYILEEEL